jgi:hypothetical protein
MQLYNKLHGNSVKSTKNPEYGWGNIKSEPDQNGVVKVEFPSLKKTLELPIKDFVLPTGKQELPSEQKPEQTHTTYDPNINYAKDPQHHAFVEWLWKNAEIIWQGDQQDADEFAKWYKKVTGENPKGRGFYIDKPGYRDYDRGEHMRIDWPDTNPIPADVKTKKPSEIKITQSGGKFHISSTVFAKQLIENFGFRIGNQPKTNFPGLQMKADTPIAEAPTTPIEPSIDQSLDAITNFFG